MKSAPVDLLLFSATDNILPENLRLFTDVLYLRPSPIAAPPEGPKLFATKTSVNGDEGKKKKSVHKFKQNFVVNIIRTIDQYELKRFVCDQKFSECLSTITADVAHQTK